MMCYDAQNKNDAYVPEKIFVIKHGALGDFIYVLGAMKAIRRHHPKDRIILLTTTPYEKLAQKTGYFDRIVVDEKPTYLQRKKWKMLGMWLRKENFDRVYDLQNSTRTEAYFIFMFGRPLTPWSAEFPQAAYPYANPLRKTLHAIVRKQRQLAITGILNVSDPDVSFLQGDLSSFHLPQSYFLLVPGSSIKGAFKRWPAPYYGAVAKNLVRCGLTPLILGTAEEEIEAHLIQKICPEALNLCGQTSLDQIASLARGAMGALGNDTGPIHLIGVTGCLVTTLFSGASDPYVFGPRGPQSTLLQQHDLKELTVEKVWATLVEKHNL